MKKLIPVLLIILLFCGCTAPDDVITEQVPTVSGQTQLNESSPTPTADLTPMPEPTPVRPVKSVALPAVVSEYEQFLTHVSGDESSEFVTEMGTPIESLLSPVDDAYYVEFDPDKMNILQLARPSMPTYSWYINGSNSDKIAEVVVEFDLLETIDPLHPDYFGYDEGYFITVQHPLLIPFFPSWCEINYSQADPSMFEVVENATIGIHETGEDLKKYAEQEGRHVKITIPYSEFQSAAKDLALQFMPGTTFANLSVALWGSGALNTDTIDEISEEVETPERDLMRDVIIPALQTTEDVILPFSDAENEELFRDAVFGSNFIVWGCTVNTDGSVSIPVSFYELGEYADEVQGKYAVIPEGLISTFMILSSYSCLDGACDGDVRLWKSNERVLVDFVFENLIDEDGQIFGIYDIEQGKLVATDRKSPALPILSAILLNTDQRGVLTNKEIDFIINSIIANDLIRVDDTLYYAPRGISDDGIMELKLSDFAVSSELFEVFLEYSNDRSRLDEEYGCAMLLEGFANSLKLILEGQEQNMTRLPSSELTVIFTDGGSSYELQPSETFDINDPFFSMRLMSLNYIETEDLKFIKTKSSCAGKLSGGEDGVYSESQKQYIRECEAQYAEVYNAYIIQTTCYESWRRIYNFLQMQPSETAYAPKYNVHTGEMIEASVDTLYPEYSQYSAMLKRFGTPVTMMNYHLLVGIFNDEDAMSETAYLTMVDFDLFSSSMFSPEEADYSNPDIFADNGFNVFECGSLCTLGGLPSAEPKIDPYDKSGFNLGREGWREYTMRKLNEQIRSEEDYVAIDNEFPLFYDHLPKVEIVD